MIKLIIMMYKIINFVGIPKVYETFESIKDRIAGMTDKGLKGRVKNSIQLNYLTRL